MNDAIRMDDVEQRVIAVIRQTAALGDVDIHTGSRFSELAIDSLEVVNICFELEQEFGIEIPNVQTQNVEGIPEVVAFVRELLAERAAR
jgi:acyl carrier protein